jgi:hypothetical protein
MADIETCIQRNKYWAVEGNERIEFLRERISDDLRQLLWDLSAFSENSNLDVTEKIELDLLRENKPSVMLALSDLKYNLIIFYNRIFNLSKRVINKIKRTINGH